MNGQAGTHASMFAAYFPGDAYTITFEPTPEQSSAMVRLATKHADSDSQAETLLMMLGIIPSESAFNPTAHDAWTRKPPRHEPTYANVEVGLDGSTMCRNGHVRSDYSYMNAQGKVRCRACGNASVAAYRARVKERKAA